MNRVTLFLAEYNCYNGYVLHILNVDCGRLDGSLFGLNFCRDFLYVSVMFFEFEVFYRKDKSK